MTPEQLRRRSIQRHLMRGWVFLSGMIVALWMGR